MGKGEKEKQKMSSFVQEYENKKEAGNWNRKVLFNQRKTTKPAERRRIFIRMNHSRPTKTKPLQVSNIRTGCTGPGRQERSAIRTWKVTSLEGLYFFPFLLYKYCLNFVILFYPTIFE